MSEKVHFLHFFFFFIRVFFFVACVFQAGESSVSKFKAYLWFISISIFLAIWCPNVQFQINMQKYLIETERITLVSWDQKFYLLFFFVSVILLIFFLSFPRNHIWLKYEVHFGYFLTNFICINMYFNFILQFAMNQGLKMQIAFWFQLKWSSKYSIYYDA